MTSYLGQLAIVQPALKQPVVKMNMGRLIQQRSSADDRELAQGLKEEVRVDVGYYETADDKGHSKGLK